jgi:hypothetical protein
MDDELHDKTDAGTPLNVTLPVDAPKLCPVIVTDTPPDPKSGVSEVMIGEFGPVGIGVSTYCVMGLDVTAL